MDDRKSISVKACQLLGLKSNRAINYNDNQIMVRCPFHGVDKTPSMGINLLKGQYHCFACGEHGSIENLYWKLTGNSLNKDLGLSTDAFSSYARLKNLKIYEYKEDFTLKTQDIDFDEGKTIYPLLNIPCTDYLKKRGITEKVIKESKMMYSDEVMVNGRLFKNRLLIPVFEGGKLISLEGRRIVENGEPKVLYPKGSSVNTLYDYDNLDRKSTLYVVEGLMDCFVLRGCDTFKNTTSIFGAQLTKRQLHLLEEFDHICVIPDSDKAGQFPLEKLKEIDKGQIYYLRVPKTLNGVVLKDVGDLPKAKMTPQELINRKWLEYKKPLAELKE